MSVCFKANESLSIRTIEESGVCKGITYVHTNIILFHLRNGIKNIFSEPYPSPFTPSSFLAVRVARAELKENLAHTQT